MKIKGYENYLISKQGDVYSVSSKINRKLIMNRGTGYLQVSLWKNNIQKTMQVHRLVAIHYIPNPKNKPQVNHINGIKTDNRVENLEWVTDSENKFHAYSEGLKDKNVLSKPISQLDKTTMKIIKRYPSANKASRDTGFNQGNITNCCIGRCKTSMGYIWRYEE